MARSSGFLTALFGALRPKARARARLKNGLPPRLKVVGAVPTEEVDARSLGRVLLEYTPSADGVPDPGEIVWTWVPYEENDGRGKDRPVLIVAAGLDGFALAVQLTSKDRTGDRDHLTVGSGDWDGQHRESWARLDRVFRVHAGSVRREASFLPEKAYRRVAAALVSRYGWTVG
ncbi:type II toxin-antitoxin system PemK/MazF family toxin [Labedella populi]|uniref:Type II toxin-antitoxin system PemK/MazF family toxin n=1 Tax=Labedella populi TaxID=2498850 RepID=A0A444QBJ1_9MICO|nr:type II toxin-antitoxin system PemK/MazF family toxin [Labedella populi]RWZ61425.1 type II toxin-antitoxin system PemK/MazF family toxin [Labedella populi]